MKTEDQAKKRHFCPRVGDRVVIGNKRDVADAAAGDDGGIVFVVTHVNPGKNRMTIAPCLPTDTIRPWPADVPFEDRA